MTLELSIPYPKLRGKDWTEEETNGGGERERAPTALPLSRQFEIIFPLRSAHRLREIFGLFGQHSNSWGERAANKVTLSDVEFFPGWPNNPLTQVLPDATWFGIDNFSPDRKIDGKKVIDKT